MSILTIKERFLQSPKGKQALKMLKKQHKKSGTSFKWKKNRPNLDVKTDLISISSLHIDEDTQRDPFDSARISRLMRIVSQPCARQFKRVIVSNRTWQEGSQQYVVVEGQGRVLAAYAMSEAAVPHDMYTFDSKREEAEFFLNQGKDVSSIKNWEKQHVMLGIPQHRLYNRALDIERVVSSTDIEYEPQKIKRVDCSKAYAGIRDSLLRAEPAANKKVKVGQRNCKVTIDIIDLMIKHCAKADQILTLRGDLFYPFTEFVLSYTKPKVGIQKLEAKINKLKEENGGKLSLDDMANACSLNICKNMLDKRKRYQLIKKW